MAWFSSLFGFGSPPPPPPPPPQSLPYEAKWNSVVNGARGAYLEDAEATCLQHGKDKCTQDECAWVQLPGWKRGDCMPRDYESENMRKHADALHELASNLRLGQMSEGVAANDDVEQMSDDVERMSECVESIWDEKEEETCVQSKKGQVLRWEDKWATPEYKRLRMELAQARVNWSQTLYEFAQQFGVAQLKMAAAAQAAATLRGNNPADGIAAVERVRALEEDLRSRRVAIVTQLESMESETKDRLLKRLLNTAIRVLAEPPDVAIAATRDNVIAKRVRLMQEVRKRRADKRTKEAVTEIEHHKKDGPHVRLSVYFESVTGWPPTIPQAAVEVDVPIRRSTEQISVSLPTARDSKFKYERLDPRKPYMYVLEAEDVEEAVKSASLPFPLHSRLGLLPPRLSNDEATARRVLLPRQFKVFTNVRLPPAQTPAGHEWVSKYTFESFPQEVRQFGVILRGLTEAAVQERMSQFIERGYDNAFKKLLQAEAKSIEEKIAVLRSTKRTTDDVFDDLFMTLVNTSHAVAALEYLFTRYVPPAKLQLAAEVFPKNLDSERTEAAVFIALMNELRELRVVSTSADERKARRGAAQRAAQLLGGILFARHISDSTDKRMSLLHRKNIMGPLSTDTKEGEASRATTTRSTKKKEHSERIAMAREEEETRRKYLNDNYEKVQADNRKKESELEQDRALRSIRRWLGLKRNQKKTSEEDAKVRKVMLGVAKQEKNDAKQEQQHQERETHEFSDSEMVKFERAFSSYKKGLIHRALLPIILASVDDNRMRLRDEILAEDHTGRSGAYHSMSAKYGMHEVVKEKDRELQTLEQDLKERVEKMESVLDIARDSRSTVSIRLDAIEGFLRERETFLAAYGSEDDTLNNLLPNRDDVIKLLVLLNLPVMEEEQKPLSEPTAAAADAHVKAVLNDDYITVLDAIRSLRNSTREFREKLLNHAARVSIDVDNDTVGSVAERLLTEHRPTRVEEIESHKKKYEELLKNFAATVHDQTFRDFDTALSDADAGLSNSNDLKEVLVARFEYDRAQKQQERDAIAAAAAAAAAQEKQRQDEIMAQQIKDEQRRKTDADKISGQAEYEMELAKVREKEQPVRTTVESVEEPAHSVAPVIRSKRPNADMIDSWVRDLQAMPVRTSFERTLTAERLKSIILDAVDRMENPLTVKSSLSDVRNAVLRSPQHAIYMKAAEMKSAEQRGTGWLEEIPSQLKAKTAKLLDMNQITTREKKEISGAKSDEEKTALIETQWNKVVNSIYDGILMIGADQLEVVKQPPDGIKDMISRLLLQGRFNMNTPKGQVRDMVVRMFTDISAIYARITNPKDFVIKIHPESVEKAKSVIADLLLQDKINLSSNAQAVRTLVDRKLASTGKLEDMKAAEGEPELEEVSKIDEETLRKRVERARAEAESAKKVIETTGSSTDEVIAASLAEVRANAKLVAAENQLSKMTGDPSLSTDAAPAKKASRVRDVAPSNTTKSEEEGMVQTDAGSDPKFIMYQRGLELWGDKLSIRDLEKYVAPRYKWLRNQQDIIYTFGAFLETLNNDDKRRALYALYVTLVKIAVAMRITPPVATNFSLFALPFDGTLPDTVFADITAIKTQQAVTDQSEADVSEEEDEKEGHVAIFNKGIQVWNRIAPGLDLLKYYRGVTKPRDGTTWTLYLTPTHRKLLNQMKPRQQRWALYALYVLISQFVAGDKDKDGFLEVPAQKDFYNGKKLLFNGVIPNELLGVDLTVPSSSTESGVQEEKRDEKSIAYETGLKIWKDEVKVDMAPAIRTLKPVQINPPAIIADYKRKLDAKTLTREKRSLALYALYVELVRLVRDKKKSIAVPKPDDFGEPLTFAELPPFSGGGSSSDCQLQRRLHLPHRGSGLGTNRLHKRILRAGGTDLLEEFVPLDDTDNNWYTEKVNTVTGELTRAQSDVNAEVREVRSAVRASIEARQNARSDPSNEDNKARLLAAIERENSLTATKPSSEKVAQLNQAKSAKAVIDGFKPLGTLKTAFPSKVCVLPTMPESSCRGLTLPVTEEEEANVVDQTVLLKRSIDALNTAIKALQTLLVDVN